jgi:hypothetical protein
MRRMLASIVSAVVGIGLCATPASAAEASPTATMATTRRTCLDIRNVGTDQFRSVVRVTAMAGRVSHPADLGQPLNRRSSSRVDVSSVE